MEVMPVRLSDQEQFRALLWCSGRYWLMYRAPAPTFWIAKTEWERIEQAMAARPAQASDLDSEDQ